MRHLFFLFPFLLAPLAPLHSAQEPPDAAVIAEIRSDAERGDADAQINLGVLYEKGDGVVQDYVEARNWYLKAAERGDIDAQFNLGLLYATGQGVPQDYVEARNWWLKAADQGDIDAQFNLGLLYATAQGIPQDYVEARNWWLKAAEQGYVDAQFNLGLLYSGGHGVAQNWKWSPKAVEHGDATGQGIPQDYTMAYVWLYIAAAQGSADAKKAGEAVAAKLNAASLAEAQKLFKEYFKRYVEPFQ